MLRTKITTMSIRGFTLIEFSIVIIIIAFLIAGISAGTSLIKQAEMNSIVTDFKSFQSSYDAFLKQYAAVPGDFINGDTMWPSCSATHIACTGNENGIIDSAAESLAAWRELALAQMISYQAITDPSTAPTPLVVGENVPPSKVKNGGYMMIQGNEQVISSIGAGQGGGGPFTGLWNDSRTNAVFFGGPSPQWWTTQFMDSSLLLAVDAFSIDQKIDDGIINVNSMSATGAATGFVRAFDAGNDTLGPTYQQDCLTASGNFNVYKVDTTNVGCITGMALN